MKGKNEYNNAAASLIEKFTIVKVREPKTALYFRVEKARQDLNFAQFQAAVKKTLPTYDAATSTATFTEKSGVHTSVKLNIQKSGVRWSALPIVTANGTVRIPDSSFAIDSQPLALKNGNLEIRSKSDYKKFTVNR